MLDLALQFLHRQLDQYFTLRSGSDAVTTLLTRVVDEAGKYAFEQGHIGMSVVNIEEERSVKEHLPHYAYINGVHVVHQPELRLNLYVLFTANLKVYDEALKYLAYVMTFFQSHPSFTSESYPDLDPRIEKLIVELQSLNLEQVNQLWGFLGAKQLPGIVYKVRMIALQDGEPGAVQPPIGTITSTLYGQ
jgi:hypothetical protein